MQSLLMWYGQLMELSKINPIMSGIIGAWLATVVTLLCRNVPTKIWHWIRYNSIRSIGMNNIERTGVNDDYQAFLDWFNTRKSWRWTRHWQRTEIRRTGGGYDRVTVPGYSTHYFLWKGRLFWFSKSKQDSDGVEFQKEYLTINGLFVTEKLLFEFMDTVRWVSPPKGKKTTSVAYRWISGKEGEGWWDEVKALPSRPLKTIAQPEGFSLSIVQLINNFLDSEEWYLKKGIPFKLSFELTGPPGTGKTSLVRAIGSELARDIYIIRWKEHSDTSLWKALAAIPPGSLVLIEDYDSNCNLWSRDYVRKMHADEEEPTRWTLSDAACPSLSGVLNAFDGIIPLDGLILFWTSNEPEKIDPAVRRDGRMDHRLVVGNLQHVDVVRFIRDIFPDEEAAFRRLDDYVFDEIAGARLSNLLINSKGSFSDFVESIPHVKQPIGFYDGCRPLADHYDMVVILDGQPNRNGHQYPGMTIQAPDIPAELLLDQENSYSMRAIGEGDDLRFLSVGVHPPHTGSDIPPENRFPENGS